MTPNEVYALTNSEYQALTDYMVWLGRERERQARRKR